MVALAVLGAAVGLGRPAWAQDADPATGWRIASAPHIDLWYHGLAVVEFRGFGPLALYDEFYPAEIRREKGGRAAPASELDQQANRFREAFSGDSTFEFLHFLPLYFAAADRESMLGALRALAENVARPAIPSAAAQFGANATSIVISELEKRQLVAQFANALDDEWRLFYAADRDRRRAAREARLAALQERWDRVFEPALTPYLRSARLDRGVILVSPALGQEGRIFRGDLENRTDNLVAVGLRPAGSRPDAELHAAVRELCFPLVRQAIDASGIEFADRFEGERVSSQAAVVCGATLLDRFAPSVALDYRRNYVIGGDEADPGTVTEAFAAAHGLDSRLDTALRSVVDSIE